jgi:periplasmic divalent cation tolerance protein
MSSRCIVYMTAADRAEALAIGRVLVAERLAACVNVLGDITSIYRWEGTVQEDGEVAVIAKTTSERVAALTERVKTLHSYTVPCVVELPINKGNPEFLKWIDDEVTP